MHTPGFEPRSPAWKAGILAVELYVPNKKEKNIVL